MVKELEDTPHDEVAVLLDADGRSVVGDSFDVQVRAAGSILLAHAATEPPLGADAHDVTAGDMSRGVVRRRLAAGTGAACGSRAQWQRAARRASSAGTAPRPSHATELVAVTAALDAALADALLERSLARQADLARPGRVRELPRGRSTAGRIRRC